LTASRSDQAEQMEFLRSPQPATSLRNRSRWRGLFRSVRNHANELCIRYIRIARSLLVNEPMNLVLAERVQNLRGRSRNWGSREKLIAGGLTPGFYSFAMVRSL
jgi:hypothetical protein